MSSKSLGYEDKKIAQIGPDSPITSASRDQYSPHKEIQEKQDSVEASPDGNEPEYATGFRLFLIMFTIFMSTILTALEIGIISTAIPAITDEFHRIDDVGWYGSATFLLAGPSAPLWGKLYKFLHVKWVFLASLAFYLIGSILAAAAPNSTSIIVGRAIQGLGGSGTLGGSILVINYVAQPKSRPVLLGSWMGTYMISTILGPLIGGAFTSGVGWRWCFWINLPLGGPIVILVLLFLRIPKHIKPEIATWKEIILQLDIPGFSVLLVSLVCLTLSLQWGGQTKTWDEGSVIATLILFIFFTALFIVIEWMQADRAMAPLKLLQPRLTWANALYSYISNAAMFQILFYLPIYFQSIHGQSAIRSGVNSLPFLGFFAFGAMLSGGLVGKTRLLQPYQLASALVMTAGMALFYTLEVDSSQARYIGPQVLLGFGLGLGSQVPMTAVQGFSKSEDVAPATGIMLMCQAISGGYFIAVAQCLFANRMLQALEITAPNLDATQVLNTGASMVQHVFIGRDRLAITEAYMVGIKAVFACALACSVCAVFLALLIPFVKLPGYVSKKETVTKI